MNQTSSESVIWRTSFSSDSFLKLDLGSVKTSAAAADEFLKLESKLDILVSSFLGHLATQLAPF